MNQLLPIDRYADLLREWLLTEDALERETLLLEVDLVARTLLEEQATQDELVSLHHQAKLSVVASLLDPRRTDLGPERAQRILVQLASGEAIAPMLTLLLPRQLETIRRIEKAEETLRFKDMQRVRTLAAGVAHDFNNLMGSILGQVELCRQDHGSDPILSQRLDTIAMSIQRGVSLVDDLYQFAQSLPLKLVPIRLGPWLADSFTVLAASLPPGVTLQVTDDRPGCVQADPFKLEQVLLNLVKNAGYAMRKRGGEVRVMLTRETNSQGHDMACIKVIDQGEGIPADALPHIFTPFFTTKPVGQGTGLGLAAALGIVQQHGGSLGVSRSAPGMTEFKVLLPLLETGGSMSEVPGNSASRKMQPGR